MKNLTLLSLVAASLLFTACGEKTKEAAGDAANKVTEAVKADSASAVEATKKAAADAAEATKAKAAKVAAAAKVEADKMAAAAAEKAAEVKAAAEAKASEAAQALKDRAAAVTEAVSSAPVEPAAYAKCKGCHGADGKTKALGKAAILAGQDKAALVSAINGYKAGTRNVAGMGALMKGQVASMSDADIEAVADYLSKI